MRKQQYPGLLALIAFILLQPAAVIAQTSFQFQYGKLTNPFSGAEEYTTILTVQQAAQWRYGDSFFFIDFLEDGVPDGFNDKSIYGEWYPTLSIGKLTNTEISIGPIRDISIIAGFNADSDANVLKYLPGVRASWNVPGFFFVNTDLTALIDASSGTAHGGAPTTSNSFVFDINWGTAFGTDSQTFGFFGHAEYIGSQTNEFGSEVKSWLLVQPQLTYDLSKAINGEGNMLFVGIEYQYWWNKLGTTATDNVVQLLVVWQL